MDARQDEIARDHSLSVKIFCSSEGNGIDCDSIFSIEGRQQEQYLNSTQISNTKSEMNKLETLSFTHLSAPIIFKVVLSLAYTVLTSTWNGKIDILL